MDFVGKPTTSGSWDEGLDNCINIFETLSAMCEVTLAEKLKAVPVTLTGEELNYYANNVRGCGDFHKAMDLIRAWYSNEDLKSRILTKWKFMTLEE